MSITVGNAREKILNTQKTIEAEVFLANKEYIKNAFLKTKIKGRKHQKWFFVYLS